MPGATSSSNVKKAIFKNSINFGAFARDLKALSIGSYKDCTHCNLCIDGKKSIEFVIQYLILLDLEIAEHKYLETHAPKKWVVLIHDLYIFSNQIKFRLTPIERLIYKDFFKTCEVFKPKNKRKIAAICIMDLG